jgi:hypothetical protein
MRNLNQLNAFRRMEIERRVHGTNGDHTCGMFTLASPIDALPLNIIAAVGLGWDHVSVSREDRCPTWEEMEYVKHRFFQGHEVAVQFHVPACDHINQHPFCLHLWRPTEVKLPRPPGFMVG